MESEACNTQKCGEFRKFITPLQDCCSVKRSPACTPQLQFSESGSNHSQISVMQHYTHRRDEPSPLSQCVMTSEMDDEINIFASLIEYSKFEFKIKAQCFNQNFQKNSSDGRVRIKSTLPQSYVRYTLSR